MTYLSGAKEDSLWTQKSEHSWKENIFDKPSTSEMKCYGLARNQFKFPSVYGRLRIGITC